MPNLLWTFETSDTENSSVPKLAPAGGKNFSAPVDVVNDFFWTNAKLGSAGGRQEVPTLILKERSVKTNSFIAQLIYSTGAGLDSEKSIEASLAKLVGINGLSSKSTDVDGMVTAAEQSVTSGKLSKLIPESVKKVLLSALQSAQDDSTFLSDPWLAAYKGLYFTEPTGWIYYLPFFTNKYQTTANAWGDGSGDSGGQFFLNKFADLASAGAGLLGDLSTLAKNEGTYQERPKFYQYSKEGDSITVSFPLINAGSATYDDVVRNWQFIYLLLYQNRPERINRNILTPPPIYEAEIPGVRYMPLSFISAIDVEYRGSRRTMKIAVPASGGGSNTFETIIPEAFQLNLTISSLVSESRNFMYAAVAKPNNIIVGSVTEQQISTQLNLPENLNTAEQINRIQQTTAQTGQEFLA